MTEILYKTNKEDLYKKLGDLAVPKFWDYEDKDLVPYTDDEPVFTAREITNYIERGDYDKDRVNYGEDDEPIFTDREIVNYIERGDYDKDAELPAPLFDEEMQEILNRPVTVYINVPARWEASTYVDNKLVKKEESKVVEPVIEQNPHLTKRWKKSDYTVTVPKKEIAQDYARPSRVKRALRGLRALLF